MLKHAKLCTYSGEVGAIHKKKNTLKTVRKIVLFVIIIITQTHTIYDT